MKVALIGGGNMGFAFAQSIISKKVINPGSLVIAEREAEKRELIQRATGCLVTEAPNELIRNCSIIVLAVKPQDFHSAAQALHTWIQHDQVILSFMAGVTLERLSNELGSPPYLVRSMPNLPFQIGIGMTVYITSPDLPDDRRSDAEILLNACGDSLQVFNEDLLNSATAVSGSGPGYVFYLIEQFLKSAAALGFSKEESKLLVEKTLRGSIELWSKSEHSANELRAMVTSRGGTTAAAVEVFEAGRLGEVFQHGLTRARDRSRELSG